MQEGKLWQYEYDPSGNLIKAMDPLGNETSAEYDGNGNRILQKDAELRETRYTYDERNRLVETIDALSGVSQLVYDPDGRVIQKIDPEGKSVYSQYDADGRLVIEIDGAGNEIAYEYGDGGGSDCIVMLRRRFQSADKGYISHLHQRICLQPARPQDCREGLAKRYRVTRKFIRVRRCRQSDYPN